MDVQAVIDFYLLIFILTINVLERKFAFLPGEARHGANLKFSLLAHNK